MRQRRNVDRLTSEMEELFADLWYHRLAPQRRGFRPRVDVYRTAEPPAIHVVAELPGIDPEQVDVAVNDGVLVISGHRQRPQLRPQVRAHRDRLRPFERRIVLGDAFDRGRRRRRTRARPSRSPPLRQRKPGPVRVPVREGETE
jgi:HSP20 family protein